MSATLHETAPLMEGHPKSFPWSAAFLGVCGTLGFVAAVVSTQSSSSFLMSSTTSSVASTIEPVVAPRYVSAQQPSQSQMFAARAPVADAPEDAVQPATTPAIPSPVVVGAVAAVSALIGALVMYLRGQRHRSIALASSSGVAPMNMRAAAPFDSSRPAYGHGRARVALQAAKGGKGGAGAGKVAGLIKLAIQAGKATAAPPVGPALGQYGLNIVQFCKEYNARTEEQAKDGLIIPVEITAFADRSFTFILKTPPASVLIKKAAGITTGSGNPSREKVGSITTAQLEDIAKIKLPDLNTNDVAMAMRVVEGTARNMGVTIEA